MDQFSEKNFITTKYAGELSGYTSDYLARLARSGKIVGKRIGHSWLIDKESLARFLDEQGDRKIDYARALARAREEEYRAHRSPLRRVLKGPLTSLHKTIGHRLSDIPTVSLGLAGSSLRSQAFALSVATLVVVSGAFAANAEVVPQLAERMASVAREAASGFGATFSDIPSHLAARIDATKNAIRMVSSRVAIKNERSSARIAPSLLTEFYPASLQMHIEEHDRTPYNTTPTFASAPSVPVVTAADVQSLVLGTYSFVTDPSHIAESLTNAYFAFGEHAYDAINASFALYRSLIDRSGAATLALAATTRDSLTQTPLLVSQMNLAFGRGIIGATHAAIHADVSLAYVGAAAAPAASALTLHSLGEAGRATIAFGTGLARATARVPALAAALYLGATAAPTRAGPALAQAVFAAEYRTAINFVALANEVTTHYALALQGLGEAGYEAAASTRHTTNAAILALRSLGEVGPAALSDSTLGALGKGAVALDKAGATLRSSQFAAALATALPALNLSEQAALATYETIQHFFVSVNGGLAFLFGRPPTIVYPSGVLPPPRTVVTATSTPVTPRITTITSPTYTTVVRGVSEDFVNQSLAMLRTNILNTVAGMIQPVSNQVATNSNTIQYVNMIQKLDGLIVTNGDFRGGSLTNATGVSATSGSFTTLSGGTTSLGAATVTGTLTVSGGLSSDTAITAPYFIATSTAATSTFAGSVNVDNGGLVYATSTRRVGIGTTSPTYALSVEGSSSLGTQAIAGYFTATTSTATSTFAGSLAVGTSTPFGNGLFTLGTSTPLLYVSANTGNLGIGTSSPVSKLSVVGESAFAGGATIGLGDAGIAAPTNGLLVQGSLGIGTTSPTATLGIQGSIGVSPTHLFLSADGRIGIGTTSPDAMLSLLQNVNGVPFISAYRVTDSAPSGDFINYKSAAGTTLFRVDNSGNLLAGGIVNSGSQTITSISTPQFRIQYDASNEITTSVSNVGATTLGVNGSAPSLTFTPQSNSVNTFRFTNAASAPILSIDTLNQRVGIGTTSPYSLLSISNNLNTPANTPLFTIASTTGGTSTSTLMTVLASGNVGIGTSSPDSKLSISANTTAGAGSGALAGTVFRTVGTDATNNRMQMDAFGGFNSITGVRANGTAASPTGLIDGDDMWLAQGIGYGSTQYLAAAQGRIRIRAAGTWTNTSAPTYISFETAAAGSISASERMRIDSSGNVGIGLGLGNIPTYKLDVTGLGHFTGLVDAANFVATSTSVASTFAYNVGIGTNSPGNLLTVNAPVTADATTNVLVTAASTVLKALVVQGQAVATVPIFEIQRSDGLAYAALYPANSAGAVGSRAVLSVGDGVGGGYLRGYDGVILSNSNDVGLSRNAAGIAEVNSGSATYLGGSLAKLVASGIGIGTTSPYAMLSISNSATTPVNGTLFAIASTTGGTSTSTLFSVLANGNVSLGAGASTTVNGPLLVHGTPTQGSSLTLQRGNAAGDNSLSFADQAGTQLLQLYTAANTGYSYLTGYQSFLSFGTSVGGETLRIDTSRNSRFTGNVIPTTDLTYDLGTTAANWNHLYAAYASTTQISSTGNAYFATTAGNVGIGTTSPYSLLSISNSVSTAANTPLFTIASTTAGTATTTLLTVLASGNVGVGTANPDSDTLLSLNRTSGTAGISFMNAGVVKGYIGVDVTASNLIQGSAANDMVLRSATNMLFSIGSAEKMRILNDGNVGIGIIAPTSKLEVAAALSIPFRINNVISPDTDRADLSLFSNSLSNNLFRIGSITASGGVTFQGTAASLSSIKVPLVFNPDGGNVGIGTTSPLARLDIAGTLGSQSDLFNVSSTTATNVVSSLFKVQANGSVGIGTSTPAYLLDVNGVARANGLITNGSLVFTSSSTALSTLTSYGGFNGYINASGGIGTGGADSILNAQRLTAMGNLTNIGSIQGGELNLTRGGTFATKVDYGAGGSNAAVALGDLNGDGKLDMAIADSAGARIGVLINNGSGTFATAVHYAVSGTGPFGVAIRDLNGDGKPDMMSANGDNITVSVFINNGNGTFAAKVDYASPVDQPHSIALGDLNGDGRPDMTVTGIDSGGGVGVFINNGNGTFVAAVEYATGANPGAVALGDLNGDGKPDMVMVDQNGSFLSVFMNKGNGTFAAKVSTVTDASSVAIGDLNGDGKADLAVGNGSVVSVFIGNGNGTFATKVDYAAGPSGVAISDLNGDGKPDIATGNGSVVSVLINNGNGTFATKVDYAVTANVTSIAAGDLNGDGKPDLVTTNFAGTVSVLLNTATPMLFAQASTGNIGIGSSSPMSALTVVASSTASALTIQHGTSITATGPLMSFLSSTGSNSANEIGNIRGFNLTVKGSLVDATNLNNPNAVDVSGRYAYVTSGDTRFTVVDISNPSAPAVVGSILPGGATAVKVSGRYAYVSADTSFRVIDISNPSVPVVIGTLSDTINLGQANSVYVSGHYAYVGAVLAPGHFTIVDVANPRVPVIVSSLTIASPHSVYVSGRYAYIAQYTGSGATGRLLIVDISNPTAPFIATTVITAGLDGGGRPGALTVSGRYAYVADYDTGKLAIYDVASTTLGVVGTVSGLGNPQAVAVSGHYAYVTNESNQHQMFVIDVASSTAPSLVASLTDTTNLSNPIFLQVVGRYAYVADKATNRLTIIDLAGIDVPNANIGNLQSTDITTWNNLNVGNNGYFRGGVNIGAGGLQVDGLGNFSMYATTSLANLGALGALNASITDVNTGGLADVISLTHTGTAAATNGIGSGLLFVNSTDSNAATSTSRIASILTNVANATPASVLTFSNKNTTGSLTEFMRLDQNGKLGIGTTSPYSLLSISNSATTAVNTPLFTIASTTGGTSTSTLMTVLANGNVGLGTNAPTAPLTLMVNDPADSTIYRQYAAKATNPVNTSAYFTSRGTIASPSATQLDDIIGGFTARGYGTNAYGDTGKGGVFVRAQQNWTNSAQGTYIYFETNANDSTSQTEKMRLTGEGILVIGGGAASAEATSESAKLEVAGAVLLRSVSAAKPLNLYDSNTGIHRITNGSSDTTGDLQLFGTFTANTAALGLIGHSDVVLGTKNGGDRAGLVLNSSGNVGIGTTSPYSLLSISNNLNTAANTPLFTIASTTGGTSTSTLMTVLANGNIGIGTTTPGTLLSIGNTTNFINFDNTGTSTISNNLYVKGTLRATVSYVGDLVFGNGFRLTEGDVNAPVQTLNLQNQLGSTTVSFTDTGNVGIGTNTPNHTLDVNGDIGAISFVNTSTRSAKTDITYLTSDEASTTLARLESLKVATYRYKIEDQSDPLRLGLISEDTQTLAPEILAPGGKGVDIYKLATFTLAGVQALAAKVGEQETRLVSLEARMDALESGAVSSASGSPVNFSSSSIASALEGFGVFIQKGIAQFGTLVFDQFVAATDSNGASSAGTITILAGNTVAQVTNTYVKPTSKIFVTLTASTTGSWYVSDKQNGSFRLTLSEPQPTDVSFDYFIIQTEGQVATSTPSTSLGGETPKSSSIDTEAPVIILLGDNPVRLPLGGAYVEPGVTVTDAVDGTGTYATFVNGVEVPDPAAVIDTGSEATYIITYSATDQRGNLATATRSVIVGSTSSSTSDSDTSDGAASGESATSTSTSTTTASSTPPADTTAPVVTLSGDAAVQLAVGDTFTDPGATAIDDTDGDLTASIAVAGTVDTATAGSYPLTYTATDAAGNSGSASRTVTVVAPVSDTASSTSSSSDSTATSTTP